MKDKILDFLDSMLEHVILPSIIAMFIVIPLVLYTVNFYLNPWISALLFCGGILLSIRFGRWCSSKIRN